MLKVTDVRGAQWTVRRRWWYDMTDWGDLHDGGYGLSGLLVSVALPAVWWPFWFLAHWLGWPWRVVVFQGDRVIAEEEVRGWLRSRRRIRQLADDVPASKLAS